MRTLKNKYTENVQTPIFEPFPEPRTMPDGWDLSELIPGQDAALSLLAPLSDETHLDL